MLRKLLFLLLATAACLLSVSPAAADTFAFSYSGNGAAGMFSGSGYFDATPLSGDSYLVTAINGTQSGDPMTLLGVNTFASNDNLFFSTGPNFDEQGLSFSAGGHDYNIYYYATDQNYIAVGCPVGSTCETGDTYGVTSTPIQGSVSAVPEPGSFVMLGSGLLGLAGSARRRFLKT